MNIVAFNIETDGNPNLIDAIPDPELRLGRMKDPEKIAEKKAERRQQQLQRMALDPHFGRVLCISLCRQNGEGLKVKTVFRQTDDDSGEAELLAMFWEALARLQPHVVTFNGTGFDVPFLTRRSLLLGAVPLAIDTDRHHCRHCLATKQYGHTDVMLALHENEPGGNSNPLNISRSLSFYAQQILGVEWPFAHVDQSKLGELAQTAEGTRTIEGLCEWNTRRTLELYERVARYYP